MRKSARFRFTCAAVAATLLLPLGAGAVEEGEPAPEFAARSLDGSGLISLAPHRGKVVYLDFWASWCGPCVRAVPAIEKLRQELPASDFEVVAVNLDRDPERARAFLKDHRVGYRSASDPEGDVPEVFRLRSMPTSYIIDRQGIVRHVHEGFHDGDMDDIRERVRALIARDGVAGR